MSTAAVAALVVVLVLSRSGSGDAAATRSLTSTSPPAHATSSKAPASAPCRIIPRTAKLTWSGPAPSSFAGIAVPNSDRPAGDDACEAQADNIVYHVDVSAVSLHTPKQGVPGATRVTFGGTVAFVSRDSTVTTWLFQSGDYSGEVFFQAVGPPTVALPSEHDTEELIRLVVDGASHRD